MKLTSVYSNKMRFYGINIISDQLVKLFESFHFHISVFTGELKQWTIRKL